MKEGRALFSEKVSAQGFNFKKQSLESEIWTISAQTDQSSSLIHIDIFEKMVQSEVQKLKTDPKGGEMPLFLQKIVHIRFTMLKNITLGCYQFDNNITNIQVLALFNCPVLTNLGLDKNDISNVRSLRKMKTNRLTSVSIAGNPIEDLLKFREWNIPYLSQIYLQSYDRGVACEFALSSAAAWEAQPTTICIDTEARVRQQTVWGMLQHKFASGIDLGYQFDYEGEVNDEYRSHGHDEDGQNQEEQEGGDQDQDQDDDDEQ